ncbi:quinone oxidoreductase Qor1, partial [Blyttiomyces helicus]
AAAGGTGQILVQLCRHFGAHVIGTTSSDAKAATAKKAGAHDVIIYTKQDIVAEVLRITDGKGVHCVFDGVGKTTFDQSLASLRRLGFLLSFGNASGKVADVDIMKIVPRAIRLMRPSLYEFLKSKEDYELLIGQTLALYANKKFTLAISPAYPLADAAQAHADIEGGKTQGKLVIRIAP